jgi:hypothetical protein
MSRTNLRISRALDLSLTANGIYRNTLGQAPGGAVQTLGLRLTNPEQARALYDTLLYLPAEGQQRQRGATIAKRGYGAFASSYTPLPWLVLRATLGGDYTLRTSETLTRASVKSAAERIFGITDFDRQYELKLPDIRKDIADGGALSIKSTPTLFINGVRVEQILPPAYFEQAIQLELNKSAGK